MQIRLETIISNISGDQLCNPGKAVTSYSSRKLQEAVGKRCVCVCVCERERERERETERQRGEREMERQRDRETKTEAGRFCCWLEFYCLSLLIKD